MMTETKNCQNCKNNFTIESEDFNFYAKMSLPAPTFCSDCRFQRRLMFRNNRVFYKRECAMCYKSVLSVYNKETPFTVYCRECWLGDKWDPLDYGREIDFSKPFLQQFRELQLAVPRANLYQTNFVSSEYCNYGMDFKECYLLFGGHNNERVLFGNQVFDSQDSMDICFSEKMEFCHEVFESSRSNKLFFSHHSSDCVDSSYLIDCRNCMNCFGCVGLVNKQYYVFNQPYSKEEYLNFLNSNNVGSYKTHQTILQELEDLRLKAVHRYARIYKSVDSTGDDLYEARNTSNSFSSREAEDSKYLFFIRNKAKDCYDNSFQGFNTELVYEFAHGFGGQNVAFGVRNFFNHDARYNEECHDSSNIFGCVGLRKKNYCILNKEYSKEEYEALLPKLIKHMADVPYTDQKGRVYKYGEFFPTDFTPFAYNETIAQEYFPFTKDEALERGYGWKDQEVRNYVVDIKTEDVPDDIKYTAEGIVGKVITCAHAGTCLEQCTEAFKIVPEEFKFYKRMNLPLPRLCPNCRHYQRLKLRNPMKLWKRKCMCDKKNHFHGNDHCQVEFKTTYSPDRPEIVFCEQCYQQEIY